MIFGKKTKNRAGTIRIKRKKGVVYLSTPSKISIALGTMGVLFWVATILTFTIPVIPRIWYLIEPGTSEVLAGVLRRPVVQFEDVLVESGEIEVYQPALDESLPMENRLIIPKIGVDTQLIEEPHERYEEALRLGVWRVPDFGTPYERDYPTILAAHRFGYLAWTNQYRRQNSFFNLPKLESGDRVEMIWGQRRYVFEIYAADEGVELGDYTADLVLYTCRFLESDIRIFRYARLLTE